MNNGNLQAFLLGAYWEITLLGVVLYWILQTLQTYDERTLEYNKTHKTTHKTLSDSVSTSIGMALIIPRLLLPFAVGYTFGFVAGAAQFVLAWLAVVRLPERTGSSLPYGDECLPGW